MTFFWDLVFSIILLCVFLLYYRSSGTSLSPASKQDLFFSFLHVLQALLFFSLFLEYHTESNWGGIYRSEGLLPTAGAYGFGEFLLPLEETETDSLILILNELMSTSWGFWDSRAYWYVPHYEMFGMSVDFFEELVLMPVNSFFFSDVFENRDLGSFYFWQIVANTLQLNSYTPDVFLWFNHLYYPEWLFLKPNRALVGLRMVVLILGFFYLLYVDWTFRNRLSTESTESFSFEFVALIGLVIYMLRFLMNANDCFAIIILLEVISFSSVILLGSQLTRASKRSLWPVEASLKYFLMGGFSLLLLSIAGILMMFLTGFSSLSALNYVFFFQPQVYVLYYEIFALAILFFVAGFFVKLGVFPFHQWLADVYDGADFLITVFLMSVVSPLFLLKFVLLVKHFALFDFFPLHSVILLPIGILSIFFGTVLAFGQTRLKRFLAYTSLTHSGFILVFLSTNLLLGYLGAFFYIFVYLIMLHLLFSILVGLKMLHPFASFIYLNDFKRLRETKVFGFGFIIVILSFAGIPPFAGFFSKYFLLFILVLKGWLGVAFFLVPIYVVNAYFYMRLITLTFFESREMESASFYFYNKHAKKYYLLKLPGSGGVDGSFQIFKIFSDEGLFAFGLSLVFLIFFIVFLPGIVQSFWFFFFDFLLYV